MASRDLEAPSRVLQGVEEMQLESHWEALDAQISRPSIWMLMAAHDWDKRIAGHRRRYGILALLVIVGLLVSYLMLALPVEIAVELYDGRCPRKANRPKRVTASFLILYLYTTMIDAVARSKGLLFFAYVNRTTAEPRPIDSKYCFLGVAVNVVSLQLITIATYRLFIHSTTYTDMVLNCIALHFLTTLDVEMVRLLAASRRTIVVLLEARNAFRSLVAHAKGRGMSQSARLFLDATDSPAPTRRATSPVHDDAEHVAKGALGAARPEPASGARRSLHETFACIFRFFTVAQITCCLVTLVAVASCL